MFPEVEMGHFSAVTTLCLRPKFACRDVSPLPQVNGVGLLVREGIGGKLYFFFLLVPRGQQFCHFITRIDFPTVPSNLIFVEDLTRTALNVYISTSIMIIHTFSKMTEAFSMALIFYP